VLFWFAWRFLSLARSAPSDTRPGLPRTSRAGAFRDGALAALLNPKTPLFFAAVFGASGLATASTADRSAFALVVCLLHFAWFAGVALVLDRIGARQGSGPVLRLGAGAIAAVLATAGVMALRG
jgi:threonine/homoserine/homoserine lactone efflux protein